MEEKSAKREHYLGGKNNNTKTDKDQHKKKMYNHQDYTDTDIHTQNGKFICFSVLQNQSILQV